MITVAKQSGPNLTARDDERFLQYIPAIERYARLAFRNLRPHECDEAICEVVASAFYAFRRLAELDQLAVAYASPLARFGVARVRAGRHAGNRLSTTDVGALAAQRRRGFRLESLSSPRSESAAWSEALIDDTLTPIPDQVAFRLDFPAWLRGLSRNKRRMAKFLVLGNTPSEAAQRFHVSRARVSQMRSELQASWQAFQREPNIWTVVS